jgi:hypothetical protein
MDIQKEIIKGLATELAKRDRDSLIQKVSLLSFERAYEELNGYNLTIDEISMRGKTIGFNVFFDCNYKSIATTIFRTEKGGCEVYETVDVWLSDISSPIDTITL